MTDERKALQATLESTGDADFLRPRLVFAAHRIIELIVDGRARAMHGECSSGMSSSATAAVITTGKLRRA
jgi:hypothetical protein